MLFIFNVLIKGADQKLPRTVKAGVETNFLSKAFYFSGIRQKQRDIINAKQWTEIQAQVAILQRVCLCHRSRRGEFNTAQIEVHLEVGHFKIHLKRFITPVLLLERHSMCAPELHNGFGYAGLLDILGNIGQRHVEGIGYLPKGRDSTSGVLITPDIVFICDHPAESICPNLLVSVAAGNAFIVAAIVVVVSDDTNGEGVFDHRYIEHASQHGIVATFICRR